MNTVVHRMQILCTPMDTLFVSRAMRTGTLKKMFTITKCPPMYSYADQLNGCKNDVSQKKSASSTGYTRTETFYGSIISAMLEYLKAVK